MKFSIISDTAGTKVAELACELNEILASRVQEKYSYVDINIVVGFRCLPETHRYQSFTRYTKKDKYLILDIYLCQEDYIKMYKIEQRFHLGNTFIDYLKKAFEKRSFDGLDSYEFIEYVITLGKGASTSGWFSDEIDWSLDLEK